MKNIDLFSSKSLRLQHFYFSLLMALVKNLKVMTMEYCCVFSDLHYTEEIAIQTKVNAKELSTLFQGIRECCVMGYNLQVRDKCCILCQIASFIHGIENSQFFTHFPTKKWVWCRVGSRRIKMTLTLTISIVCLFQCRIQAYFRPKFCTQTY